MKPTVTGHDVLALTAHVGAHTLVPIAEGDDSGAYRLETPGQNRVLRLNTDRSGFDKDAWAARTFLSLPIPKIHDIFSVGQNWACLSALAPGVSFQRVSPADLPSAARAVAQALTAIHCADISTTHGLGPIDTAGNGTFASWSDFIAAPPVTDTALPASLQTDPIYRRALAAISTHPRTDHSRPHPRRFRRRQHPP